MKNNIREAGTPPRWGCLAAGLESPGAPTVRQQGTPIGARPRADDMLFN